MQVNWAGKWEDEDGKYDSCAYDLDGDNQLDVLANDTNFDGQVDQYLIVDENFESIGEIRTIEEDGALINLWLLDFDKDGQAEKYGLDYNRDGRPDFFRDFAT